MPHYLLTNVENVVGFSDRYTKAGDTLSVTCRALLTSDDPEFYKYTEQISNIFLNKAQVSVDAVYKILVVIHHNLSADLYVNDFQVVAEIRAKRSDIKQGEVITKGDIADVSKLKFPEITITATDKVIYCFKCGWRFGLFFDFTPGVQSAGVQNSHQITKLDVEKMMLSLGEIYRYLSFYHVYKVLESNKQFEEMMKDGWFPFIEIIAEEYEKLSEMYKNKYDFENRIHVLVDSFTEERIKMITEKWWRNQIFKDKKTIIEAGISAYLQNTSGGFVNCIKNLWTEIEGILRKLYLTEKGKGDGVKSNDLIGFIIEKAKNKTVSDSSLFLTSPFIKYLQRVVFANFNVETGKVDMSRNASSHGVAEVHQYTKAQALQLILILDQIYFYA